MTVSILFFNISMSFIPCLCNQHIVTVLISSLTIFIFYLESLVYLRLLCLLMNTIWYWNIISAIIFCIFYVFCFAFFSVLPLDYLCFPGCRKRFLTRIFILGRPCCHCKGSMNRGDWAMPLGQPLALELIHYFPCHIIHPFKKEFYTYYVYFSCILVFCSGRCYRLGSLESRLFARD